MKIKDYLKPSTIVCLLCILCVGCNRNSVEPVSNPIPTPNSAMYKLGDVDLLASSYGKGLRLMSVWSHDVNPDGMSGTWNYDYSDNLFPPTSYVFRSTSSTVEFNSTHPTGVGAGFISHNWCNSDLALFIAEQNRSLEWQTCM